MFGITPLGWIHTLGSLPAIPIAMYMFLRHGRIVPHSTLGRTYLASMMIGACTIFIVSTKPEAYAAAVVTIIFLVVGYSVRWLSRLGRAVIYIETVCLSVSAFLLMVPSVSETLRRVPNGHPIASDPKSPVLLGALGILLVTLLLGVGAQIVYLRRSPGRQ